MVLLIASVTERLVAGQLVTIDQVKQTYQQPVSVALGLIQQELPWNQYVLTRQNLIVRIQPLEVNCQVCGTSSIAEKFLKCTHCSRDLYLDHFEELGSVPVKFNYYCRTGFFYLIVLILTCLMIFIQHPVDTTGVPTTNPESIKKDVDSLYNRTGSFSVSNTSETFELFMLDYHPLIGETWNVAITLDSNSTTGVNITFSTDPPDPNKWEGPAQFTMQPGDTVHKTYISHVCGDNLALLIPSFKLELINMTGFAFGYYSAVVIKYGYHHPDCGTRQAIIPNIT